MSVSFSLTVRRVDSRLMEVRTYEETNVYDFRNMCEQPICEVTCTLCFSQGWRLTRYTQLPSLLLRASARVWLCSF